MIFSAPALIIPPEKPAIVRACDLRGLPSWQEMQRRERALKEGTFPFPVVPPLGHGAAQTAKSYTLSSDNNNGVATKAWRVKIASIAFGGSQIRVRFVASSTGSYIAPHCSVGKMATAPSMSTNPPVELLFSAVSGFSLTSGQTITSDWANLSTVAGDNLIVDIDATTDNARDSAAGGDDAYQKSGASDYNTATVSGYTLNSARVIGLNLVEVRT